jgi:hypothetical protein
MKVYCHSKSDIPRRKNPICVPLALQIKRCLQGSP